MLRHPRPEKEIGKDKEGILKPFKPVPPSTPSLMKVRYILNSFTAQSLDLASCPDSVLNVVPSCIVFKQLAACDASVCDVSWYLLHNICERGIVGEESGPKELLGMKSRIKEYQKCGSHHLGSEKCELM